MTIEIALYFSAMAPWARQSAMIGPKTRWFSSARAAREDPLAKQKAARMTKGVVGITGRIAPIAPMESAKAPSRVHAGRPIRLGETLIRVMAPGKSMPQ